MRARALRDDPAGPLPVYAPPGSLDAVLALDRPGMLAGACELHDIRAGSRLDIGPFQAEIRLLPHWVPNAGVRLAAGGVVLTYTGDCGPAAEVAELAAGAAAAGAGQLMLTHLWPGTDASSALQAAGQDYDGPIGGAAADLALSLR